MKTVSAAKWRTNMKNTRTLSLFDEKVSFDAGDMTWLLVLDRHMLCCPKRVENC